MTYEQELMVMVLTHLKNFDNEAELVEELKVNGIRGTRNEPEYCPLALYLNKKFDKRFYVDENKIVCTQGYTHCTTPQVCQDFIDDFDSGVFPELELRKVLKNV